MPSAALIDAGGLVAAASPEPVVELGKEMFKAAFDGYRVVQEVEAADESKPDPS